MRKPDPLKEAVEKAARIAYHETELSESGERMKTEWEEDAQEWVEDELDLELWTATYRAVGRTILSTEGGLRGLSAWRESEEADPLPDSDALYAYLAEEKWDLALLGKLSTFRITVWSHPAFDGSFACAVAEDLDEDRSLAMLTALL